MTSEVYSVLLISKDTKISSMITSMLVPPVFDLTLCTDYNEARRIAKERSFQIVIVDSDDSGDADLAVDISDSLSTVLLMVPGVHFDQVSYSVEAYGILTITKPFDAFYFYNMIKIAIAVHYKINILSSQTVKLKEKMEEIRQVNRAKMLLMQSLSMTEQEAHRYLEKQAMDRGMKRLAVAEEVIRNYG